MAKRLLKCYYCGQTFDANSEPFAQVSNRRYAHEICAQNAEIKKRQEELDKQELEDYIKNLFDIPELTRKINTQIKTFRTENKYSYSGILKTLKYWYDVKKNITEKANGGIGIVSYIWDEAYNYWYKIWEAQKKNEDVPPVDIQTEVVHISSPKRQPIISQYGLFSFLDSEDDANNEQ